MRIHIVQNDQDLGDIAGKYGVSVNLLKRQNSISDERIVLPGLQLKIKEDNMKIEDFKELDDTQGMKYVCPYCKKILLIPE